jgi:hypothetical protein
MELLSLAAQQNPMMMGGMPGMGMGMDPMGGMGMPPGDYMGGMGGYGGPSGMQF